MSKKSIKPTFDSLNTKTRRF